MLGVKCLDTDSQQAAGDLVSALLLLTLEVFLKCLKVSARRLCSELVSASNKCQPVPEGSDKLS